MRYQALSIIIACLSLNISSLSHAQNNPHNAIHLIYDERQQESEQRREHITQLEANQQVWKDKKQQLDQIEQEIMRSKQFLDLKQQQLHQQIQQYNQEQLSAQHNQSFHKSNGKTNSTYFQQRLAQELQSNIELVQQEVNQYNQRITHHFKSKNR